MTAVGPVSAVETLRAQRKQAPFRPLPEAPPGLTNVTFTEQDLHAHQTLPLQIPAPPPISLGERLDLSRPVTNTTAFITEALVASLPVGVVTLRSYARAQIQAYT